MEAARLNSEVPKKVISLQNSSANRFHPCSHKADSAGKTLARQAAELAWIQYENEIRYNPALVCSSQPVVCKLCVAGAVDGCAFDGLAIRSAGNAGRPASFKALAVES